MRSTSFLVNVFVVNPLYHILKLLLLFIGSYHFNTYSFLLYVEKIKPFLLLIHKRKSKIKNGFFYCLKEGMQNVEVRNNKKMKFGGK